MATIMYGEMDEETLQLVHKAFSETALPSPVDLMRAWRALDVTTIMCYAALYIPWMSLHEERPDKDVVENLDHQFDLIGRMSGMQLGLINIDILSVKLFFNGLLTSSFDDANNDVLAEIFSTFCECEDPACRWLLAKEACLSMRPFQKFVSGMISSLCASVIGEYKVSREEVEAWNARTLAKIQKEHNDRLLDRPDLNPVSWNKSVEIYNTQVQKILSSGDYLEMFSFMLLTLIGELGGESLKTGAVHECLEDLGQVVCRSEYARFQMDNKKRKEPTQVSNPSEWLKEITSDGNQ